MCPYCRAGTPTVPLTPRSRIVDTSIQAYIREAASRGRHTERVGPFLATFTDDTDNPYLSYAIPDDDAVPTQSEVHRARCRVSLASTAAAPRISAEPCSRGGGRARRGRVRRRRPPPLDGVLARRAGRALGTAWRRAVGSGVGRGSLRRGRGAARGLWRPASDGEGRAATGWRRAYRVSSRCSRDVATGEAAGAATYSVPLRSRHHRGRRGRRARAVCRGIASGRGVAYPHCVRDAV